MRAWGLRLRGFRPHIKYTLRHKDMNDINWEALFTQRLQQGLRPAEQVRAFVPHIIDCTGHLLPRAVAIRPGKGGWFEIGLFGFRADILTRIFRTGGRVTPEKVIRVRSPMAAVNTALNELGVH